MCVEKKLVVLGVLVAFYIAVLVAGLAYSEAPKKWSRAIDTPIRKIAATFYEPRSGAKQGYVVILIHGWSASRTYVNFMAVELTRMGYRVIAIDQPGHQSSEPVMTLDASLRDLRLMAVRSLERTLAISESLQKVAEEFAGKDAKIILIGHSLGGALSIMLASKMRNVELVIALAPLPPYEYVNATCPKKLVVILGEFDEVFSVEEEAELLRRAGWESPEPGKKFVNGEIARAFYVLRGVDHIWEPYSGEAARIIAEWVGAPAGYKPVISAIAALTIVVCPLVGLVIFPLLLEYVAGFFGIEFEVSRKFLDSSFDSEGVPAKDGVLLGLASSLLIYLLVALPLGISFVPLFPRTSFRWALVPLFMGAVYPVMLLHEFVFHRAIPRRISRKLGERWTFATSFAVSAIER